MRFLIELGATMLAAAVVFAVVQPLHEGLGWLGVGLTGVIAGLTSARAVRRENEHARTAEKDRSDVDA